MPSRPPKTDSQGKGVAVGANAVLIDGKYLTLEQVVEVARGRLPVRLATIARTQSATAYESMRRVAQQRPVYGQSTGVGSNKETMVEDSESERHGLLLLKSHAACAGPSVSDELTRAMMVIRLNQLAAGGSGVHPRLLDALAQALNKQLVPPLKRFGSIGTGDLSALATTALCIMGERPWTGGTMLAYPFESSDALAFMSSNAATLGEATLSTSFIEHQLQVGLKIAALTYIAMGGSPEAYDAQVHEARPHQGQIAAAESLRRLLEADLLRPARRIQDPYGLRALPQVQGAALDAVVELKRVLLVEINASSENPLVSSTADELYHNGNFHSIYTSLALDKLRASLYGAASLSVARIGGLMAPGNTYLRPFLAEGPAASSGVLIVEYIAHSALAELRHLATQDSLGNAVLSHGAEEHASFATQSAWHATESVPVFETILACELLAAVRAMLQQGLAPRSSPLCELFDMAVAVLGTGTAESSIEEEVASLATYLREL